MYQISEWLTADQIEMVKVEIARAARKRGRGPCSGTRVFEAACWGVYRAIYRFDDRKRTAFAPFARRKVRRHVAAAWDRP